MKESRSIVGWFAGTCTNTTVNQSANLLLCNHGAANGRLHGELGLYGPLLGGGPFHARLHRGRIEFTTCLPALQVVIEWTGDRTREGFSGTNHVVCDNPGMVASELREQAGVWSCVFVRDPGEPAADRIELISVFHEGRCSGPFVMEDFMLHAAADRWPSHALVALQDCSVWNTVGDFLASLNARTMDRN